MQKMVSCFCCDLVGGTNMYSDWNLVGISPSSKFNSLKAEQNSQVQENTPSSFPKKEHFRLKEYSINLFFTFAKQNTLAVEDDVTSFAANRIAGHHLVGVFCESAEGETYEICICHHPLNRLASACGLRRSCGSCSCGSCSGGCSGSGR